MKDGIFSWYFLNIEVLMICIIEDKKYKYFYCIYRWYKKIKLYEMKMFLFLFVVCLMWNKVVGIYGGCMSYSMSYIDVVG